MSDLQAKTEQELDVCPVCGKATQYSEYAPKAKEGEVPTDKVYEQWKCNAGNGKDSCGRWSRLKGKIYLPFWKSWSGKPQPVDQSSIEDIVPGGSAGDDCPI